MNISVISANQTPNFEARIRVTKRSAKSLAQSVIGTAALGTAGASMAEGVISAQAVFGDPNNSVGGVIPKEMTESHNGLLTSAGHGYDAAGEWEGIPCQSTIAPVGAVASSIVPLKGASNAFTLATGQKNIDASTVGSGAFSANKSVQSSVLGGGYLSSAAASLYSGFNEEQSQHAVPSAYHSAESLLGANYKEQSDIAESSIITGGLGLGIPASSMLIKSSGALSKTDSVKFVADTLNGRNEKTEIPS